MLLFRLLPTVLNAVPILPLRPVMAATAPRAIKPATRAYSIRSWPDSSFIKATNACLIFFVMDFLPLYFVQASCPRASFDTLGDAGFDSPIGVNQEKMSLRRTLTPLVTYDFCVRRPTLAQPGGGTATHSRSARGPSVYVDCSTGSLLRLEA